MSNVGTAAKGKTLIGDGSGASPVFDDIGTESGLTAHGVVVAQGTGSFTATSAGTAGLQLTSNGGSADPTYQSASVPGGGTGVTSWTPYAVVIGGTTSTSALQQVSGLGTLGQELISNGSGTAPTWQSKTAFVAKISGTKTDITGNGDTYVVPFTNVITNVGSAWNGTDTFTAPVNGIYMFCVNFTFAGVTASHTYGRVNMNITGGLGASSPQFKPANMVNSTSDQANLPMSYISPMNATDTMTVDFAISGGTKVVDITNGTISGFLIQRT